MPRVVVAGSENSFDFAVIDFSTPSNPTVKSVNPAFGGGCRVAIDGSNAAVGNVLGGNVSLYDVSNPASPTLKGTFNSQLSGIGAIAIRGARVAVGEWVGTGNRIKLLSFSNPSSPQLIGTANTTMGMFNSIAFLSDNIVVGSGPNNFNCVEVDFSNPSSPAISTFNPQLSGGVSLDADANSNRITVGDMNGSNVKLLHGTTKAVIQTVGTQLGGVTSIAISGNRVLAGSANSFNAVLIDFGPSPATKATFNPVLGGGCVVAIEGTDGVCGAILGTNVKLFDLSSAPPSPQGVPANAGISSISSLGISNFTLPPPSAPNIAAPANVSFGVIKANTTASKQIPIQNTGNAPLNVSSITSTDSHFTVNPAGPFTIQQANSTNVNITFAPANAETTFTGNLQINSNDPDTPTMNVSVSGTGALPHISIMPTNLDFGDVAICQSGTRSVDIKNTGNIDLTVSSISTSAPFSANPANAIVGPNATKSIIVTFTPTVTGQVNGSLSISSDDTSNPTKIVPLVGNGLPMLPPAISVTPTSLDFGATSLQFFIGLRLTVANTGPCQNLSVTLNTSGAPFFVTDVDPTTVPPSVQPVNATIVPNSSKRFVVVFAPTQVGNAAGSLTITSNASNSPTVTVGLSGIGVQVSPVSFELVLDRSGSMSVGGKMGALKNAVHLFADLVIPGQGYAMGSVEFDDAFSVLTALAPYDTAQQSAIKTGVDTLTPRNFTSIGGGLQLAQSQIGTSSLGRKVIIVFTDGLENTSPMITDVEPGILAAGIEVYAVGLGQPQYISAAALSALAASSNGKYFQTEDTLILRKLFVEVLADAFRQNLAADPIITLNQKQTIDVPVDITTCERRITFVLNWENPASAIRMEIIAPDGTVITPNAVFSNQLVRYGYRPGYQFYQIAFPPIDPGSGLTIGPARLGRWLMRITPTGLVGTTERCVTSVMVESDLTMEMSIKTTNVRKPVLVVANLLQRGEPITDAKVNLIIHVPMQSLAQVQTPKIIQKALQADRKPIDINERPLIKTRIVKHELKPKKKGIFASKLVAPEIDGIYQYTVQVRGQGCGGTFERYTSRSLYIGRKEDRRRTETKVIPMGDVGAIVTVIPRDSRGVCLGSGRISSIQAAVKGGAILGVTDNLDGSYSVRVAWSDRIEKPMLILMVGKSSLRIPLG